MALRYHIALIVLLPLAALGVLMASGYKLVLPTLGRGYVLQVPMSESGTDFTLPPVLGARGSQFPLVVLDPGHGGFDYGATGEGYREKDLALGLALALRDELVKTHDIRVAMTRDSDHFVPLDDRLAMARQLGADLFVSIHADSAGDKSEVTGASIYTLSNEASSKLAAQFAARENAADKVNGVELGEHSRAVNDILLDLSQRQTQAQSREFAQLIERSGEGLLQFHPQTQRSASLVVLRSPDVPSVLYEAGFVTNASDAARLSSTKGRVNFSAAIARAIRTFLVRRETGNQPSDR